MLFQPADAAFAKFPASWRMFSSSFFFLFHLFFVALFSSSIPCEVSFSARAQVPFEVWPAWSRLHVSFILQLSPFIPSSRNRSRVYVRVCNVLRVTSCTLNACRLKCSSPAGASNNITLSHEIRISLLSCYQCFHDESHVSVPSITTRATYSGF